ncbi:MAG: Gfo/Idh/MocA family oxidoreductase, partial [Candidatus Latescibacteria bacterium]|nr:Gfo/Idh/MocA family oxidoreductase [Candidatus Latescibacterota bacterium]
MNKKSNRRRFIKGTALAGGTLAGNGVLHRKARAQSRKTPTVELLKVGVIGVEDYTHLPSIWGPTINPTEPEYWPIRSTRMLMTHCWAPRQEKAQEFAQRYGCEVVKNYYDMVDKVDAMIFGGYYEVKWWPQITKPYLEAGIPSFIERPFAVSMKDAKTIIDTAKKYNTPILCTDEREYIKEVPVARWKVEELIREGKTILGVTSDNSAADYPAHGTHGIYFLLAILGLDVEQISFQADGWWHGTQNWGLVSLQYNGIKIDDVGEQKKSFIASQQQIAGHQSNGGIRIYYNGGWWDIM